MPRLPDETAIERTQVRSVDSVVVGSPDPIGGAASAFGAGVQQLGQGIGNAGRIFGGVIEKEQTDADRYKVENDLIRFEKDHRRFLDEQKNKSEGDPQGFAVSSRKAFDERADGIYKAASPRLQPIIKNRLQSLDGNFHNEASNFENARRDTYYGKSVSDNLDGLRGEVAADPSKHAEIKERGLALIRIAPISTVMKERLTEQWTSGSALSAAQSDIQRDPAGARSSIGYGVTPEIVKRIVGVESGGDANAKNPKSTATGAGQFIEGTWLKFIAETRPDLASDKQAALALRKDPRVASEAVAWYARANAKGRFRASHSQFL